jgi:hypothetical protein
MLGVQVIREPYLTLPHTHTHTHTPKMLHRLTELRIHGLTTLCISLLVNGGNCDKVLHNPQHPWKCLASLSLQDHVQAEFQSYCSSDFLASDRPHLALCVGHKTPQMPFLWMWFCKSILVLSVSHRKSSHRGAGCSMAFIKLAMRCAGAVLLLEPSLGSPPLTSRKTILSFRMDERGDYSVPPRSQTCLLGMA